MAFPVVVPCFLNSQSTLPEAWHVRVPELVHTGSAFKRSFFTVLYSSSLLCPRLAPNTFFPLLVRTGFKWSAQDMLQGIGLSQVENGLHLLTYVRDAVISCKAVSRFGLMHNL